MSRAMRRNYSPPHIIDADELRAHLSAEQWQMYASSSRERKRLYVRLGAAGFRVTVDEIETYRGNNASDAVRAYNEATGQE